MAVQHDIDGIRRGEPGVDIVFVNDEEIVPEDVPDDDETAGGHQDQVRPVDPGQPLRLPVQVVVRVQEPEGGGEHVPQIDPGVGEPGRKPAEGRRTPVRQEGEQLHQAAAAGDEQQQRQEPGIQVLSLTGHVAVGDDDQRQEHPDAVRDHDRLKIQMSRLL